MHFLLLELAVYRIPIAIFITFLDCNLVVYFYDDCYS